MNLGNQKLFNFDDAMQSPRGFLGAILFHQRDRRVNLMQDLLEPKFISLAHDELLFITVHQAYELWVKQILHEIDAALSLMKKDRAQEATGGLHRIVGMENL